MFNLANISKNKILATLLFLGLTVWWLLINYTSVGDSELTREYFSASYGLMALFGGLLGLHLSKTFDGYQSTLGKVILYISLGLLLQEFGQIVYSLYSFVLMIEIPYPSLGDLGFFGSIPMYIIAAALLAKTFGIAVKASNRWLQATSIVLLMLGVSYHYFLEEYVFEGANLLTVMLDFGYPLGQSIYVAVALLIYLFARKELGGKLRNKILLLLIAFVIQYVADFMFLYQVNMETWTTGGVNELTYLIAYFVMTLSLINLSKLFENSASPPMRNTLSTSGGAS